MQGTLVQPLDWQRLAFLAAAAVLVGINLILALPSFLATVTGTVTFDWRIYVEASERFWTGGLYGREPWYAFPYSPLFALGFGAIEWIGPTAWRLLHLGAALAMPSWPLRLLTLVSWPFWVDTHNGNVMTFVALAGVYAVRGHRTGQVAFLVLAVLIPRPLMVPVVAWLLWRDRSLILPFVGLAVASIMAAWMTGWLPAWIGELTMPGRPLVLPQYLLILLVPLALADRIRTDRIGVRRGRDGVEPGVGDEVAA